MSTVEEGKWAEQVAAEFLERNEFEILDRNFYFKKVGELDLVCRKNGVIIFVEVRHRSSLRYGTPEESLTYTKCAKLRRCAEAWLMRHKLFNAPCRFDMIAVDTAKGRTDIRHHINAF
jgi:putative endonuclease